ncbi:hypothetical protein LZ30DRAFT_402824 [Colletotrichum cereale]|nr:hypothetical protein LZ30DRAFT_402824 [Colletotrichum cereale]
MEKKKRSTLKKTHTVPTSTFAANLRRSHRHAEKKKKKREKKGQATNTTTTSSPPPGETRIKRGTYVLVRPPCHREKLRFQTPYEREESGERLRKRRLLTVRSSPLEDRECNAVHFRTGGRRTNQPTPSQRATTVLDDGGEWGGGEVFVWLCRPT